MDMYQGVVNCIYNIADNCCHADMRKRFLFWGYKPYCNNADNCSLRKTKYPRPSSPPSRDALIEREIQNMKIKPIEMTIDTRQLDEAIKKAEYLQKLNTEICTKSKYNVAIESLIEIAKNSCDTMARIEACRVILEVHKYESEQMQRDFDV